VSAPVRVEREGDVAVVVIDNPPVNATSHAVREALMRSIGEVDADPHLIGAVLVGAGRTFVAGADIREFGAPLAAPQMPAVIAAIMDSPKVFVAALHGNALGGGFELALACDARIAAPGTRMGLPEVTLGMIPGAGGTQHLPRLVGMAAAIELVCSGRRMEADEALRLGLVDALPADSAAAFPGTALTALAEPHGLRAAAIAAVRRLHGHKRRVRDLPLPAEDAAMVEAAAGDALAAHGDSPQVRAAIEAVRSAATMPYAEAMAREREAFQSLRASEAAAALREKFFAARARKP
jgi:3-hydroxyacyl-CoA dehydrogenase